MKEISQLHPSLRIVCLIVFAIVAAKIPLIQLLIVFTLMLLCLAYRGLKPYLKICTRLRWLFVSIFLIYAFNTPGEYLDYTLFDIAPTYEGLYQGMRHILSLLAMTAALSLLLAITSREQLIAGMLVLLVPLNWMKVDTQRFAARLWLTLHYVESGEPDSQQGFIVKIEHFLKIETETQDDVTVIKIKLPVFKIWDCVVLIGLGLSLYVLL